MVKDKLKYLFQVYFNKTIQKYRNKSKNLKDIS